MGDDDVFVPGALDQYMEFLDENEDVGYVLRRYETLSHDGRTEDFRYSTRNEYLEAGEEAVVEFFRRSVFVSGFTFRKAFFDDYECSEYDGTLLFQLYIQVAVCLKYKSAYCDICITRSIEGGTPFFGNSDVEKSLYQAGTNTVGNSINFLRQVSILADSLDEKFGISVGDKILKSYSKYSYGFLLEHRDEGSVIFRQYAKEIKKMGLGDSFLFYVYYYALLLLGRRKCQVLICKMKKLIGYTPRL